MISLTLYFPKQHFQEPPVHIRPLIAPQSGYIPQWLPSPTWTPGLPYTPGPPGNEEIISKWKESVSSTKTNDDTKSVIPEVTTGLVTLASSLSSLKDLHRKLSTVTVDESKDLWRQVAEQKITIESVTQYLCKSDAAILKKKVSRSCETRKRRKRAIAREKERTRGVEEMCSNWLKKKESQLMRKKLEESVEREAGGSLGEVRIKIQDLDNVVNLIDALKKIRKHRTTSKNWRVEGQTIQADETFTKLSSEIEQIVSTNLKVYKDEEYALKVMMSKQIDAKMTASTHTKGSSNDPIKGYYYKAEKDASSFINIRQQWDRYLTPHGGTVPIDWVEPVLPSNSVWASYLISK